MYSNEKYPSQVLQEAVEAIGSLPGVGSRSALRLALHLLGQPAEHIHHFTAAVNRLADDVHYCHICQMIADSDTCSICADRTRDARTICVVESVRDVMSIEGTGQYRGVYHVLGGIISPIDGIGPSDIRIKELIDRIRSMQVQDAAASMPDRDSDYPAIPLEGAQGVKAPSGQNVPPHILVMTATPIPRTLAMTLYGDLDVSVIDEMPPGRKPVQTMCIGQNRRAAMYKFLREEIARGRQVFVVFPLIFESEKLDYQNLEQGYEEIVNAFPLPDYKVAIVHGQQTAEQKNFNMAAFVAGRAHILVSTTVIEVGVDVPNASVMVIESAQRFGLSQLHQLRGRVGRGAEKSYCILVKDVKTSKEAQQRLDLMCATEDGFEIAEQDMKMRGPGDLEGTQQSGLPISLNIASLARDGQLLTEARLYAEQVLKADPALDAPQNAPLVRELRKDKYGIKDYSKIS
jgi:recombination protein RecR